MVKWKIVDEVRAKILGISEVPEGCISINISHIPPEVTLTEYADYILQSGVVYKYDTEEEKTTA